jgi:hypothetical protein
MGRQGEGGHAMSCRSSGHPEMLLREINFTYDARRLFSLTERIRKWSTQYFFPLNFSAPILAVALSLRSPPSERKPWAISIIQRPAFTMNHSTVSMIQYLLLRWHSCELIQSWVSFMMSDGDAEWRLKDDKKFNWLSKALWMWKCLNVRGIEVDQDRGGRVEKSNGSSSTQLYRSPRSASANICIIAILLSEEFARLKNYISTVWKDIMMSIDDLHNDSLNIHDSSLPWRGVRVGASESGCGSWQGASERFSFALRLIYAQLDRLNPEVVKTP